MADRDDGGPAFPTINAFQGLDGQQKLSTIEGMSLRDAAALAALRGLCANPGGPFQASERSGWEMVNSTPKNLAAECFRLADAFLAQRSKEKNP